MVGFFWSMSLRYCAVVMTRLPEFGFSPATERTRTTISRMRRVKKMMVRAQRWEINREIAPIAWLLMIWLVKWRSSSSNETYFGFNFGYNIIANVVWAGAVHCSARVWSHLMYLIYNFGILVYHCQCHVVTCGIRRMCNYGDDKLGSM